MSMLYFLLRKANVKNIKNKKEIKIRKNTIGAIENPFIKV